LQKFGVQTGPKQKEPGRRYLARARSADGATPGNLTGTTCITIQRSCSWVIIMPDIWVTWQPRERRSMIFPCMPTLGLKGPITAGPECTPGEGRFPALWICTVVPDRPLIFYLRTYMYLISQKLSNGMTNWEILCLFPRPGEASWVFRACCGASGSTI